MRRLVAAAIICIFNLTACEDAGLTISSRDSFHLPGFDVSQPGTEQCNGLDDDWNGETDEDWPDVGKVCAVGVGKCARTGKWVCRTDGTGVECNAQEDAPSVEKCDGFDNDCNGLTDYVELGPVADPVERERLAQERNCTWYYRDVDRDGYGVEDSTSPLCLCAADEDRHLVATKAGDCNDDNSKVHPDVNENCGNKIDDNCDGMTDTQDEDNCKCQPETVKPDCYPLTEDLIKVMGINFGSETNGSICKRGTQTCSAEGVWGDCVDFVLPNGYAEGDIQEVCDGHDSDCNGTRDDVDLDPRWEESGWFETNGFAVAEARHCTWYYRDRDNDGYGVKGKFEGLASPRCLCAEDRERYLTADRACKSTTTCDCADNEALVNPEMTESCNGIDDNCNGQTDEGNPGGDVSCETGSLGVCSAGTKKCEGGEIVCIQDVPRSDEICDGKDNNCDGQTDEGGVCPLPEECSSATGTGTFAGFHYLFCTGVKKTQPEAKAYCTTYGHSLASICSLAEDDWVRQRFSSYYWIGLEYLSGSWKWVNGDTCTYWRSGWDSGTSGGSEKCMEVQYDSSPTIGHWNSQGCTTDYWPFVCKRTI
jgi:hypothetical protein